MRSLIIHVSMKLKSTMMNQRTSDTYIQSITTTITKMSVDITPTTLILTTTGLIIAATMEKLNIVGITTATTMRNTTCQGKKPFVGHMCTSLTRI